jgi:hypothetical protein
MNFLVKDGLLSALDKAIKRLWGMLEPAPRISRVHELGTSC